MDVPQQALDIRSNYSGLPSVGLHLRGGLYYQDSSYSHFWFFGAMVFAAVVSCLFPLDVFPMNEVGLGGVKLKYYIALGCLWGGVCGLVPYFIRNAFGQKIIINPQNKTIQIQTRGNTRILTWSSILGLQLCHQKVPEDSELDGYQLNLVWKDSEGTVNRHCLLKHGTKHVVEGMGTQYERLFGFKIL